MRRFPCVGEGDLVEPTQCEPAPVGKLYAMNARCARLILSFAFQRTRKNEARTMTVSAKFAATRNLVSFGFCSKATRELIIDRHADCVDERGGAVAID